MSDWIVIPAAVGLVVASLVGMVVWWRWVQTLREPTFDELMEQLHNDWSNVQDELWNALGISVLVDRLGTILQRLDRDS